MNLLLSAAAMVFGAFIVVSPVRAARLWAAGRLDSLKPAQKAVFLGWYRIFGVILFLGGLLSSVDTIIS